MVSNPTERSGDDVVEDAEHVLVRDHDAVRLVRNRDGEANRGQRFEDLWWSLINATEFSWNH